MTSLGKQNATVFNSMLFNCTAAAVGRPPPITLPLAPCARTHTDYFAISLQIYLFHFSCNSIIVPGFLSHSLPLSVSRCSSFTFCRFVQALNSQLESPLWSRRKNNHCKTGNILKSFLQTTAEKEWREKLKQNAKNEQTNKQITRRRKANTWNVKRTSTTRKLENTKKEG